MAPSLAPAVPVAFEQVVLYRQKTSVANATTDVHDWKSVVAAAALWTPVANATTDVHGGFMFVGIKDGGEYEVRIETDLYGGSVRFSLRTAGHVTGIHLVAVKCNVPHSSTFKQGR